MNPLWEFLTVRKEQDLFLREYILLGHIKDESSWVNCGGEGNKLYIYFLVQVLEAVRNFTFQAKLFKYLNLLVS